MSRAKYDSSDSSNFELESKKMDLEAGLLGKIFGNSSNARLNIAGTIAVLLILSGIGIIFVPLEKSGISTSDYWKIIAPIITLILGYMFGKND